MGSKFNNRNRFPFWKGVSSAFDLFGVNFPSKKEFKRHTLRHSEIEVIEDDLEQFQEDFWQALRQYESQTQTIR